MNRVEEVEDGRGGTESGSQVLGLSNSAQGGFIS